MTDDVEVIDDDERGDPFENNEEIYQITSFGADFLVDGLISRLERQDIYRPSFQRNFVWTLPQASRFIESILLGLPIPGIFLYREEDTQKHLIIDGLQRLTTLEAYQRGRLPDSGRVFRLVGVRRRFENKALDELDPADQRRFMDAAIHATIIQQSKPEGDQSSVYHIFERLNTGGTPLQPQEMRAAIFHGPFQSLLEELNTYNSWRRIYGPVNKRGKDQELILRFLALYFDLNKYKSPMKTFLNKFMSKNRWINERKANEFRNIFAKTADLAVQIFGDKPFRPARALNAAVFDSVMVALATNKPSDIQRIQYAYDVLLQDAHYHGAISRSTSDEANVSTRIERAIQILQ